MSDGVFREADAGVEQKLKWIRELQKSDAYASIIIPELKRLQTLHAEAVRDRKLNSERRAEHIEASHMADDLLKLLETEEGKLKRALKR